MASILHIQRKPLPTHFSIEGYFARVRAIWGNDERPRVFQVPCYSRGVLPRIWNMLAARRQFADIYHVTGDIHYVACVLPQRRTILTVHDCQILERLTGWRRAVVRYFWFTLPARHAVVITVNSCETKKRLLEHVKYPADLVHVVPVAVSDIYKPQYKEFNTECPRILQVGTKANKNVSRLVRALRGLNCHLDIVGPVSTDLRILLGECGVQWTGWEQLSEQALLDRYRECDMVAFVSTSEGFGMPIVEAQRVGRVCVTSNLSSMPEVAGGGACLVDPFDVESIRGGIIRICGDAVYRQALVEQGKQNVKRFDAGRIAQQFEQIYMSVLAGGR